MKIMAIDYGDARTGVAVSDALGWMTGQTAVIHSWKPEKTARLPCVIIGAEISCIPICMWRRMMRGRQSRSTKSTPHGFTTRKHWREK